MSLKILTQFCPRWTCESVDQTCFEGTLRRILERYTFISIINTIIIMIIITRSFTTPLEMMPNMGKEQTFADDDLRKLELQLIKILTEISRSFHQ